MDFEFATAGRIVFGNGRIQELKDIATGYGKQVLVITGGNNPLYDLTIQDLKDNGFIVSQYKVDQEPTTDIALEAAELARNQKCELVIGIGGGSVVDTGKAVSALLTNEGDIYDYLEVIGKGQKLNNPTAPYIAIPTTAGTGAEVTRNAVLGSKTHRVKVSMRSPYMLPDVALVDPELTFSMPPDVTASTGLDALTQLMEAFVSNKANPLTDGICLEGLKRASRSLVTAFRNGDDANAREDMSIAGLFSGLALANAKLGAVHGFAGPLGGLFPAPHGVVCARLLPFVTEANVSYISSQYPDSPYLERFDTVARVLTGNVNATAQDAVVWVQQVCDELNVAHLSDFGMTEQDIPLVVDKASKASSMKGNPVVLPDEILTDILKQAL